MVESSQIIATGHEDSIVRCASEMISYGLLANVAVDGTASNARAQLRDRCVQVSVIIPALNEEARLARAISSAQQAGANEVILVDGGSQDRTLEIARAANCQVLAAHAGRARQQNVGAANATGDVLLFLHADNWLAPDAIDQIRVSLREPQAVGGAFRQRIDSPRVGFRCLETGNAARVRWLGLPYGDQGIFIRREVFERLGRFPEVRLMEDVLLMRKMRRAAWPLLLPGPIFVDPRRWQRHGIVRQTLHNWMLLTAHGLGVSTDCLADSYQRHDRD